MKVNWQDIEGYNGRYVISSDGKVFSKLSNKYIRIRQNNDGYLTVELWLRGKRKTHLLHRLILQAFGKSPVGDLEVNHINGDRTDNRLENLEWTTHSANVRHSFNNGLASHSGERNPNAVLSKNDVSLVRKFIADGVHTQRQISEIFNISETTISKIKHNKTWENA